MTLCTQFMIFSVFATKKLRSADNAAPARISRTRQFSFVTLVYEELSRFPQWSLLVLLKTNFFKFYRNRLRKYEVKPHRRPTK